MDFSLMNLNTVVRSLGRGVIFRAPVWVPGSPLPLVHLGDTEGDIVINKNPTMAALTTPELTGAAPREMDYVGEAPTIEVPMYITDPVLNALLSPSGLASAGRSRRSAPNEHTIVIFPEQMFLEPDGDGVVQSYNLGINSGVWTLDGNPLTAAQEAYLGMAFWAWRVVASTPPSRFRGGAGDDRKNIEPVTFTVMHHDDMPEGHHLYTVGDPIGFDIQIEGGS